MIANIAEAQYSAPEGGWDYMFEGDSALYTLTGEASLDGEWDHENGSDQWDGFEIGSGNGGVSALVDDAEGFNYIRLQDTGDPRSYGFTDPSNRKLYFGYDLSKNEKIPHDSPILDDGITLTFRTRIPAGAGLDALLPADGSGEVPWPVTGDGYLTHDGGKGMFGVHQYPGGTISFCLANMNDSEILLDSGKEGLIMNNKVGADVLTGVAEGVKVDLNGNTSADLAGDVLNVLEINPTEWHTFWVTIEKADAATGGTHVVNIYKDGEIQANTFFVTAGQVNADYEYNYLALGLGCTGLAGSMDVDFFGYKAGIHVPAAIAVHEESAAFLSEYKLSQNYPNPFNPSTVISFTIPSNNFVSLKVYNLLGAEIAELAGREYSASLHSLTFDASILANGEYIYELKAGKYSISKKMLLLK